MWSKKSFLDIIKENFHRNNIYPNGDIYNGCCIIRDGKELLNGNGKMIYKNGDEFEGEWKDNKIEGNGKMIYKNGDVFEGEWK
jgi:hypothetical protein